jgi:hypothetical protein
VKPVGTRCVALFGLFLWLWPSLAFADDPPVFSGPQVGERLAPLQVTLAYGGETGHKTEFISQSGGKPTLLVVVNGANRPAAGLTRVLMHYAEMQPAADLFAGIVWLTDDASGAEKYFQQAASWWGVQAPVGITVDGAEGPGSYGFNRNVNVTVLVANEKRVTANFALVQPSLTDVPKILDEVVKLTGGRPPTQAEIAYLSNPTQSFGNVRWQPAPADIELRKHICNLLAATDEPAARKAAKAIEAYVSNDNARQTDLAIAAGLIVPAREAKYQARVRNSPATEYFKAWRDKHGTRKAN